MLWVFLSQIFKIIKFMRCLVNQLVSSGQNRYHRDRFSPLNLDLNK